MKKDFNKKLKEFKEEQKSKGGAPTTNKLKTSVKEGTIDGEQRATFIVKETALKRVKQLAKENDKKIKDIINEALNLIITQYDNK